MEALKITEKYKEAPERLGKHLEVLGSTGKHQKALGSPLEIMGSIRKHLAVQGRNPKEEKH